MLENFVARSNLARERVVYFRIFRRFELKLISRIIEGKNFHHL